MQPTNDVDKATGQPDVRTNDGLKETFGDTPLFSEKVKKATRIMTLVREKQRAKK